MNKKTAAIIIIIILLTGIQAKSEEITNTYENQYETKLKLKPWLKDFFRGKAQITFRKNYRKLLKSNKPNDKKILDNIHKYRQLEMENAFKHAFVSAKSTYIIGAKYTLRAGYIKELKTHDIEIRNFGGRIPAFLDTNCDLWNDEMGVKYAISGKKRHKLFRTVGKEVYNNLVNPNSDFIIDYKNDKRRWHNVTVDNLLDTIQTEYDKNRGRFDE